MNYDSVPLRDFKDLDDWETVIFVYKSALKQIETKIDILNDEFQHRHKYNPIEHVKSRIKTPESIVKKLKRHGYESSIENMVRYVNDIAGIRISCSFTSDIYLIADMISKQNDLTILARRDYMKNPKKSGYRSYHMLVTTPVFLSDSIIDTKVEIQIRTVAQDFWATLEHKMHYKFEGIKKNLPGAKVSGGVSNLSFSFRGNNHVREAMHSVFLYHAIGKGMDMGIVNPSTSVLYEDIEPEFRTLLEDVILARRPEAAEELITYAQNLHVQASGETPEKHEAWRELSLKERLEHALIKGIGDYLEDDLQEALRIYPHAVDIIDGPLMSGMNKVGELFGAGKMFLPQVVKTARTMKKAVAILQPAIESEKKASGSAKAGKVIFATVKGDVHDIGKNIVSIVLSCNNYEVIDLGVMVPADVIIKKAIEEKPDLVCLSGLITPSLDVADEMQKAGLTIPMMVGGATTSKLHTAVKIAPHYDYPVIHVLDASQNPLIAAKLLNPDTRDAYIRELEQEQEALRASLGQKKETLASLSEARKHPIEIDWTGYTPVVPARMGVHVIPYIPLEEVIPYIHWTFFFSAWKLNGRFSEISQIHGCDSCRASWLAGFPEKDRAKATEAMQLYKDAVRLLDRLVNMKVEYCKAIYGFFSANSEGDTIRMGDIALPLLRQQVKKEENIYKCLSDYVIPVSEERTDYVGAFVVTAGAGADCLKDKFEEEGDTYNSMLLQTLTDRLAEATAEYLHEKVRKEYWGYAKDESLSIPDLYKVKYQGIRPAIGYPSLPDQLLNFTLDGLLDMSRIGVSLTENGAMYPTASVSGIYIAHPSSQYFMIGSIDEEQLKDYASRRNLTEEQARKLLSKNIG